MKHIIEVLNIDLHGTGDDPWVEFVVETRVSEPPCRADVVLSFNEREYAVSPYDLVELGAAIASYLEQRRAAEVAERKIHPYVQHMR